MKRHVQSNGREIGITMEGMQQRGSFNCTLSYYSSGLEFSCCHCGCCCQLGCWTRMCLGMSSSGSSASGAASTRCSSACSVVIPKLVLSFHVTFTARWSSRLDPFSWQWFMESSRFRLMEWHEDRNTVPQNATWMWKYVGCTSSRKLRYVFVSNLAPSLAWGCYATRCRHQLVVQQELQLRTVKSHQIFLKS